jgi:hypothetical protein
MNENELKRLLFERCGEEMNQHGVEDVRFVFREPTWKERIESKFSQTIGSKKFWLTTVLLGTATVFVTSNIVEKANEFRTNVEVNWNYLAESGKAFHVTLSIPQPPDEPSSHPHQPEAISGTTTVTVPSGFTFPLKFPFTIGKAV